MLIRWLLIALFIYLVIKLIRGPKNKKKGRSPFPFDGFQKHPSNRGRNGKPDFDQIEEAEYEDITEKEKKNSDNK
jgi:hypothetical protein